MAMVRLLIAVLMLVPSLAQAEGGQLRHMELLHAEKGKPPCVPNAINQAATKAAQDMNAALRDAGWLDNKYRAQAIIQQGDMFARRKCYLEAELSYDRVFNLTGSGVEAYRRQASERLSDLRKVSQ